MASQNQRSQTSVEGALLELIARGEKDKYFHKDDKDSTHPFDWKYKPYPAVLPEVRRIVPITEPSFGSRIDWEFDIPGDILTDASITIQLPSWIPKQYDGANMKGLVRDASGVRYGYTNGIGYFLFKKIQILQDTVVLQEFSGDALYLMDRSEGSWNSGFLTDKLRGVHGGTPLEIQRNATPGRIVLRLPVIGAQQISHSKGFPICAVRSQTFRLRVWLRSLEEIVEASDGSVAPKPWTKELFFSRDGVTWKEFQPIHKDLIEPPSLFFEVKYNYVTNEDRRALQQKNMEIPFRTPFENSFSLNAADYASIRNVLTPPFINRRLDANYTVEQLIVAFRSGAAIRSNQLYKFSNPLEGVGGGPNFYTSMQLTIAGQIREGPYTPFFYTKIVPYTNAERSTEETFSYLYWGKDYEPTVQSPAAAEPTGGINFTTADRPTLFLVPADTTVDPVIGTKYTELLVIADAWGLYGIHKQRGSLLFAN